MNERWEAIFEHLDYCQALIRHMAGHRAGLCTRELKAVEERLWVHWATMTYSLDSGL